ncbi:protein-S-isoprenylcysteine O-methyltransferase [Onthophagus taurus]|uniref:protein-S-isoprenylcysteine O-methyltransferase n=1 Tax=Onthophagus taurus TaxID=166361 RepID=UPI000C1FE852|nr:protein-S-isoprenylcysteine O-methyltransferase [Onthophagus taurus]
MICYLGKISLLSYVLTILSFSLTFLPSANYNYLSVNIFVLILAISSHFILINVFVKLICKGETYQVAVRAVLLGYVFSLGVFIKIYGNEIWKIFAVYMCILSFFHTTEYLSMAVIQPNLVNTDSYVINHSREYTIAAVASWTEFFLEAYFLPDLKCFMWLSNIGAIICICGEILRKAAMLTAKSNFTHMVQCEKQPDHVLVTHGIYRLCRHPSYVGWFYWSIGTQITLLNPFCTLAYTFVSWKFFKERIHIEEITLLHFFGQQYHEYQQKVSTGIPFIEGYKLKSL